MIKKIGRREIDFSRWKPLNAEPILITDMKTSHIKNCIKMLQENTLKYKDTMGPKALMFRIQITEEWTKVFNQELNKRKLNNELDSLLK